MPPGLVSPDRFPHRDPMDISQTNGRMINPPRRFEMSTITVADWDKEARGLTTSSGRGNVARVEKPTSIKSAHKSGKESD